MNIFPSARSRAAVAFAVVALVTLATSISGQSPMGSSRRNAELTRAELEEIVQRLEDAMASPAYSARLREQARVEAETVRERLAAGDFQVGDRVILRVLGDQRLTDTLLVHPGRVVTLPDIGDVDLTGVLRSELQEHMQNELGRYIQNPVVRAQTLVRIAVLGEVQAKGFYAVPAEALIEDVIMAAGGPGTDADLDNIMIRRGERVLWTGEALRRAVIEGWTLDQLNIRAGDRVVVPAEEGGFFSGSLLQTLIVLLPSALLLHGRLL